ncbi:MAG: prepilin-type N-terminal cleavage/methylation domain-containing protein [Candidatus Gracilibacteria bacterium]|nr:prepilin-type N-terminal cleavage/methylation domain-containing protein [Candidatus Gracilibacteria bacterium]
MKKYHTLLNKGFTILELVISVFIITLLMSGMTIMFDILGTGYKTIKLRANAYSELESYENKLENAKFTFNKNILIAGNIFFNNDKGFSLIALTTQDESNGILFGVYDTIEKNIKYGNISTYSNYSPFYININNSDINLIKSDLNNFISNINTGSLIYYSKINLLKFGYSDIPSSDKSKIDLIFTNGYYTDFYGMNISDLYQNQRFKRFRLSLIK